MQTNEEATVHVKDLDLFVTVQLLEDTPPVLPLGQLCEDHGVFLRAEVGQKTTPYQKSQKDTLQHRKLRADSRSRTVEWHFEFQYGTATYYIFITGLDARKFYAETIEKKT